MNSILGKHERSDDEPRSRDLDFTSDREDFSLPRNFQPTGYVDTDNLEQANMDTHLPETNIGYRLLLKMGWAAGTGLGCDSQGRVDPIRIDRKMDSLGIGKAEEEMEYHTSSTAQRRALDSEKQLEETEEERRQRELSTLKKEEVKSDIKETLRAFYCELCDKQYSKISEYEHHLQSYDHHHKKRFKDMRENSKLSQGAIAERESRRERERKREERENRRIQEAMLKKSGVKLEKVRDNASISSSSPGDLVGKGSLTMQTNPALTRRSNDKNQNTTAQSWGGWSTVATATNSSTDQRTGGWSAVAAEAEASSADGKPSTGGWSSVTQTTEVATVRPHAQKQSTSNPSKTDIIFDKEADVPTLFSGKKQSQKLSFGMNKKPVLKFGLKK